MYENYETGSLSSALVVQLGVQLEYNSISITYALIRSISPYILFWEILVLLAGNFHKLG